MKITMRPSLTEIIVCLIIGVVGLITLDYYNLLSIININVASFNLDFWNIFINASVVIVLYLITYNLIDKKNIKQTENKKEVARLLLSQSYEESINDIEWLEREDYRIHAARKIDFSKDINESILYKRLIERPFDNHEVILSFAKEGIVKADILEEYMKVKSQFSQAVRMSIVFYEKDKFELAQLFINKTKSNINTALEKIKYDKL